MALHISAIDKQSVHKLCSGQVVLDLATAVKELVENSIDAGATSVDVRFKDNGASGFEVIDNGSGVDPSNYENLALKHYTSKIEEFKDLEKVQTFGFRGEALSSLCALAHVVVTTSTKQQEPMGTRLEYNMNGVLVSQKPIARSAGTTISLTDIFYSLPVREKEFKRNIKKEYGNALTIMQAYSIISTQVRISVSNQVGQKSGVKVMSTSGNKELLANISNVFGAKLSTQILPFKVDLEPIIGSGSIEGYISKPEWGLGRSTSDRQYYFINGRPCVLPKIAKALNEVYRSFISKHYPVVIANVKIATDAYEVNLSPDKRTIMLHNENKITEAIVTQLQQELEPSRSTYEINPLMPASAPHLEKSSIAGTSSDDTVMKEVKVSHSVEKESTATKQPTIPSIRTPSIEILKPTSIGYTSLRDPTSSIKKTSTISDIRSFAMPDGLQFKPKASAPTKRPATANTISSFMSKKPKISERQVPVVDRNEPVAMIDEMIYTQEPDVDTPEYIERSMGVKSFSRFRNTKDYILSASPIDLPSIIERTTYIPPTSSSSDTIDSSLLENASFKNTTNDKRAAEALSRVINKTDFANMRILGQFNLGFIITSLEDHDLYIIDQHASDEKYNFETLQKTTQLNTQRMISSQLMDLTAAEELIVIDNLDIFKANGFGVEILEDNEPTKRISLVSHLTSKNTSLDKHDFTELITLINENPGKLVHCTRIKAMFASRACHKATRIGDHLTNKQMKTIVSHMGEIEQPWNCPHGRPTMRHLLNYHSFKNTQPIPPKRKLTFTGSLFSK